MTIRPTDDLVHRDATAEEWVFAAWKPDQSLGVITGHRLMGATAWYWSAVVRSDGPLLHITDWTVATRDDPYIIKAPGLWAENHCVAQMDQWSVENETFAVALDDPAEALGNGHGVPTAVAMDIEWYGTAPPVQIENGYEHDGVVHGTIQIAGTAAIEMAEIPARRWHRWGPGLDPMPFPFAPLDAGLRAPFLFPDGTTSDLLLTPLGWCQRPE